MTRRIEHSEYAHFLRMDVVLKMHEYHRQGVFSNGFAGIDGHRDVSFDVAILNRQIRKNDIRAPKSACSRKDRRALPDFENAIRVCWTRKTNRSFCFWNVGCKVINFGIIGAQKDLFFDENRSFWNQHFCGRKQNQIVLACAFYHAGDIMLQFFINIVIDAPNLSVWIVIGVFLIFSKIAFRIFLTVCDQTRFCFDRWNGVYCVYRFLCRKWSSRALGQPKKVVCFTTMNLKATYPADGFGKERWTCIDET